MEEYLAKMKETVDLLEDLGVWHTLKNLPKEYDILKQMILCDSLLLYTKLEMRLLSEEMSRRVQKTDKKESEAFVVMQSNSRRSFYRGQSLSYKFGL